MVISPRPFDFPAAARIENAVALHVVHVPPAFQPLPVRQHQRPLPVLVVVLEAALVPAPRRSNFREIPIIELAVNQLRALVKNFALPVKLPSHPLPLERQISRLIVQLPVPIDLPLSPVALVRSSILIK